MTNEQMRETSFFYSICASPSPEVYLEDSREMLFGESSTSTTNVACFLSSRTEFHRDNTLSESVSKNCSDCYRSPTYMMVNCYIHPDPITYPKPQTCHKLDYPRQSAGGSPKDSSNGKQKIVFGPGRDCSCSVCNSGCSQECSPATSNEKPEPRNSCNSGPTPCILPFPGCSFMEENPWKCENEAKCSDSKDGNQGTCPVDWDLQSLPMDMMIQQLSNPKYREVTADLLVKVKGQTFKAHRFLLAHYSRYFYNILKQRQGKMFVEVALRDINPDSFCVIYDWMYTCQLAICPENLIDVIHTAQFLDTPEVVVLCMEFLNKLVECPEQLLMLYTQAMSSGKRCLAEHILRLIAVIFRHVICSSCFLALEAEAIRFLLSCDNLNVSCEKEAFDAAIRWLCCDLENRRSHAIEILCCIRFGHMTDEQLFECLHCDATQPIMIIPECRLMVLQGYLYHTSKSMGTTQQFPHLNVIARRPLWQQLHGTGNEEKECSESEEDDSPTIERPSPCTFTSPPCMQDFSMSCLNVDKKAHLFASGQDECMKPNKPPSFGCSKGLVKTCLCPKLCSCPRSCPCPKTCSCVRSCSCPKFCSCPKMCPCPRLCSCPKMCSCPKPCVCPKPCACPKLCTCAKTSSTPSCAPPPPKKYNEPPCPAFCKLKKSCPYIPRQPPLWSSCPCGQCLQSAPCCTQEPSGHGKKFSGPGHKDQERSNACFYDKLPDQCICEDVSSACSKRKCKPAWKASRWWGWRKGPCDESAPPTNQSPGLPLGIDPELQCKAILQAECISRQLMDSEPEDPCGSSSARDKSYSRAGGDRFRSALNSPFMLKSGKECSPRTSQWSMDDNCCCRRGQETCTAKPITDVVDEAEDCSMKCDRILLLGGLNPLESWSCSTAGKMVYMYNPDKNKWKKFEELPAPRHHATAVIINQTIYVAGGCCPAHSHDGRKIEALPTAWSFNLNSIKWSKLKDMEFARIHHSMVAVGGNVYVIGGQDDSGELLSSVEMYGCNCDNWRLVSPMTSPRMGMASTCYKGMIWVCGGMGLKDPKDKCPSIVKCVEYYNPKCDNWCQVSCLRFPRCFACLVDYCGLLHIVGGVTRVSSRREGIISSVASVDVYDANADQWCFKAALQVPRHSAAAAVSCGLLYVAGGITSLEASALDCVECYDEFKHGWVRGTAHLPLPLSGMACVVVGYSNAMMDEEFL